MSSPCFQTEWATASTSQPMVYSLRLEAPSFTKPVPLPLFSYLQSGFFPQSGFGTSLLMVLWLPLCTIKCCSLFCMLILQQYPRPRAATSSRGSLFPWPQHSHSLPSPASSCTAGRAKVKALGGPIKTKKVRP